MHLGPSEGEESPDPEPVTQSSCSGCAPASTVRRWYKAIKLASELAGQLMALCQCLEPVIDLLRATGLLD